MTSRPRPSRPGLFFIRTKLLDHLLFVYSDGEGFELVIHPPDDDNMITIEINRDDPEDKYGGGVVHIDAELFRVNLERLLGSS